MRDWEQYLRHHLSLSDLARERESRMVRELASQLEDFYREAVAGGMTESAADAHARAQITDWTRLAHTLRSVDRLHVRLRTDRWSERMDDYAQVAGQVRCEQKARPHLPRCVRQITV